MGIGRLPRRAVELVREDGVSRLARSSVNFVSNRAKFAVPYVRYPYYRYKYGAAAPDPFETITVDPGRIRDGPYYNRLRDIGSIKGGEWDEKAESFEKNLTYRGLQERFVDGLDWEDTTSYEIAREDFAERGEINNYSGIEEFRKKRLSYLDELYEDIKENGYKTQVELRGENSDRTRHDKYSRHDVRTHEVGVNIGRDGRLLINSGYHRLSIARILDLESIPVNVIVRHARWQAIRQEIASSESESALDPRVRAHLSHPDVRDVVGTEGQRIPRPVFGSPK